MSKYFDNLEDFDNQNTYIFLYERAFQIEELINGFLDATELFASNLSINEGGGVLKILPPYEQIFSLMRKSFLELAYLKYRSMFQAACWEEKKQTTYISEKAYGYTDTENKTHKYIIQYVNQVLAHQDIICSIENSGDKKPKRWCYEIMKHRDGVEYVATCNILRIPPNKIKPLVELMKKSILQAYKSKYDSDLPILLTYEPLKKRF
jgi:hypothetical protein